MVALWLACENRSPHSAPDKRTEAKGLFAILNFGLLILSYAGILLCGTFTGRLATDSRALSSHPWCVIYSYSGDHKEWTSFEFDYKFQSMHLANECFNPGIGITSGCDYFMTSGIPYHTGAADCPFIDPTMCLDNGSYVIGFRTDPINARKTVNVHSCPYFVLRSKSLYQQKQ